MAAEPTQPHVVRSRSWSTCASAAALAGTRRARPSRSSWSTPASGAWASRCIHRGAGRRRHQRRFQLPGRHPQAARPLISLLDLGLVIERFDAATARD